MNATSTPSTRADLLQLVERLRRLDLDDDAELIGGSGVVSVDTSPLGRPRRRHPSDPVRGVSASQRRHVAPARRTRSSAARSFWHRGRGPASRSPDRRATPARPPRPGGRIAWSWASTVRRSLGACSVSMTSTSKPAPAQISAATGSARPRNSPHCTPAVSSANASFSRFGFTMPATPGSRRTGDATRPMPCRTAR